MNIYEAIVMTAFAAGCILTTLGWHRAEMRLERAHRKNAKLVAENERYKEMNRKQVPENILNEIVLRTYKPDVKRRTVR